MEVRYFSFSKYHNKRPPTGSTFIRMIQMEKYWSEFKEYTYGENPDVLIFQKVYCSADYKFPAQFEKKKILDICDPDWLIGNAVKETVDAVDAITCSTNRMKEFIEQMTDKPVVVIPDRFDLSVLPEPKEHISNSKKAVWFGYVHNAEAIKYGIKALEENGIELTVISNEDPFAYKWASNENYKELYTFKKYNEATIYDDLKEADFAFLPALIRPEYEFKSNNRTIKANLVGLPVVYDSASLNEYSDVKNRKKFVDNHVDEIKVKYDIRNSVEQYKELISEITS